jgi:hypothetical protein
LTAWSGTYAAARQFDGFRSWLAEGQEAAPAAPDAAARPEDPAPPTASGPAAAPVPADPEQPRFILLPILAGAIIAAAVMILTFIFKRRRRK